jgi:hypothetical protein
LFLWAMYLLYAFYIGSKVGQFVLVVEATVGLSVCVVAGTGLLAIFRRFLAAASFCSSCVALLVYSPLHPLDAYFAGLARVAVDRDFISKLYTWVYSPVNDGMPEWKTSELPPFLFDWLRRPSTGLPIVKIYTSVSFSAAENGRPSRIFEYGSIGFAFGYVPDCLEEKEIQKDIYFYVPYK